MCSRRSLLPLIVAALACGKDAAAPTSRIDVSGAWLFDAIITAQGYSCLAAGQLQLTQSGTTVTGTYRQLLTDCRSPNGAVTAIGPQTGGITNGAINRNSVRFDFGGNNWRHTGTVLEGLSGQLAMTGTVSGAVNLGGASGSAAFTNNSWRAAR